MKYIILLLYLIINILSAIINNNSEIIPEEIKHGLVNNDVWKKGKYYEYYLDISNYKLNEENIFEIYGVDISIDYNYINLYLLFTDINEVDLIKNGSIKPDIQKDIYRLNIMNNQYDSLTSENYLFIPFKKVSSSYNFFVILIENVINEEIKASFYVPNRIPSINIELTNPNITEIYSKEIEVRDNMRLYYKINLRKIDLVKNNIYIFINKIHNNNNRKVFEVHYFTNYSSFSYSDFNFFIIRKNTSNFSEISFSIKSKNKEKYTNLSIRIDNNDFYYISNYERKNTKIYVENLICDKYVFIIDDNIEYDTYSRYKYIIFQKLYGNYSIKFYESIKDLNFEKFAQENKKDYSNLLVQLKGLVNVYILKSITPSAFHLEIFTENDTPGSIDLGQTIKTVFYRGDDYYGFIHLENLNASYKYKVNVEILDYDPEVNRTLEFFFHSQGIDYITKIIEPNYYHNEILYADSDNDQYLPHFGFKTDYYIFIEYYFTSNHLIHNIAEGRTIIDSNPTNCALKIMKDSFFDYIIIEAKSKEEIFGYYELKLINDINIEDESNSLMTGLPKIQMPSSYSFKIKISNPYNKYDQIANINKKDNYFYLLFTFIINTKNPVYLDIEYIHGEQIIFLNSVTSKIIQTKIEYELFSYEYNYEKKDKILFNINRCNNLANYTFLNYYENTNNIIKESKIFESHQIILLDNKYYKSKIMLLKETEVKEEEEDDKLIYPADYYKKGDILLNYFVIESSILNELKFTSDLNINYEDGVLTWKKYISRDSNNRIDIATNYSIYILPKNSVVNTICQFYLIPSNKSIINSTEIKIELDEGEYKIGIIARVIEENMNFEILYDILELKVIKRINVILIVLLCIFGLIIVTFLILFFIFKKKILLFLKRRKLSKDINEEQINKSIMKYDFEEEEEFEIENEKNKLKAELIKKLRKG